MSEPENVVPLDQGKVTYFKVPAAVLKATLDVLNQLPRGQVNDLASALEQCVRNGDVSDG
ncbi:MAG: hypothetical protein ACR2RF_09955 [Geminicoccaceae bacterium]